jgi:hypothetical protein
MDSVGKIIGMILYWGSGILTFIFWLVALQGWLGFLGVILAFVLTPGVVVFPFVYWIVEGVFPTFYFILWGVGVIGIFVAGIFSKDE